MIDKQTKGWWEKYAVPVSLLVSVCLTILGLYCTNMLAREQDRENALLDIRISYISESFRDISYYCTLMNYKMQSYDDFLRIERALKNIQLYGTLDEISAAKALMRALQDPNIDDDFDPLLNLLRDNLRMRFGLESVEGNTHWILDTIVLPETTHTDTDDNRKTIEIPNQ